MSENPTNFLRKGNKIVITTLCGLLLISSGISAYLAYRLRTTPEGNGNEKVDFLAQNCDNVIKSIPFSIQSPGTYCLEKDFETTQTAISIESDDVQIDLSGHKLQGPGTPETQAIGIDWVSHSNISIKNGTIAGFFYGIRGSAPYDKISLGPESAASDISIQNMVLLDNGFRGILVVASRSRIKSNLIQNTGGTSVYDDAYSMGIEVVGPDCLVQGNWVLETYPRGTGEAVGISLSQSIDGCRVRENYISNENLPFPGRSFVFWIMVLGKNVQIANNFARRYTYPFKYSSSDIIIARNIFSQMECSIDDYPDYYQKYPFTFTNQFISEVKGCASDNPVTFLPLAEKGDSRAMFRLGVIARNAGDLCDNLYWWQRAASLGHKESIRQLEIKQNKELFEKAGCN